MTRLASGTFEVKMIPLAQEADVGDASVGRMALNKVFSGELDGTSRGQMLAVRTEVDGSAGYVAMERVVASLHGRVGTFALQHSGTMTRATPSLSITVVPDSGTDQLIGIAGTLEITVAEGKHGYAFEYTLPEAV